MEVQNNISLMGFILLCGLAKLGFHRAHVISSRVPESCLLIMLGILFGGMLSVFYDDQCPQNQRCIDYSWQVFPKFTPQLFFLFLLPPIVLEAAYSLHNEHFFLNIRSILCLAVVGTIINFLLTGGLLVLVKHLGWIVLDSNYSLSTIEILLFASLISAVDPVAVLSIFQEVGINPDLYFLVFGHEHVPAAQMFITTTLAVVMFTVFLQGSTIKLFVNWLHIDRKGDEHASLTEEINHKVFEHVMEGIEIICGKHGKFYTHHVINHIDDNYLKKWFCVKNYDHTLQKVFGEVTLSDMKTQIG